jgi:hypothetical protein
VRSKNKLHIKRQEQPEQIVLQSVQEFLKKSVKRKLGKIASLCKIKQFAYHIFAKKILQSPDFRDFFLWKTCQEVLTFIDKN